MNPDGDLMLPFVTRDMFRFKGGATYLLTVNIRSSSPNPMKITVLTREGPSTFQMVNPGDGTITTQTFKIPDIPIYVSCAVQLGASYKMEYYVKVGLQINGDPIVELMQGYVYSNKSLCWPAGTFEPVLPPSCGRLTWITGANPAAGAQHNDQAPQKFMYHLNAATMELVTNGNAANRYVHFKILNGENFIWDIPCPIAQVASKDYTYIFGCNGAGAVYQQDNTIYVPIPDNIWLHDGHSLFTTVTAMDAGDDWYAAIYNVDKFMYDGS